MTTRKHNEFLDIVASDDEASDNDRGYDSEENVAESKGRAVKRRRTTAKDSFAPESESESDDDKNDKQQDEEDNESDGGASLGVSAEPTTKSTKAKGKLAKLAKPPKKDKSGVIYCE